MQRRNYRLKRPIESSVNIQLVLDFDFSSFNISMFYSPLNSTKSFTPDLQVPPSNMGHLVSIKKFWLEPARTFLHEPIFARLESPCSLAEPARAHGPARLESARDMRYLDGGLSQRTNSLALQLEINSRTCETWVL